MAFSTYHYVQPPSRRKKRLLTYKRAVKSELERCGLTKRAIKHILDCVEQIGFYKPMPESVTSARRTMRGCMAKGFVVTVDFERARRIGEYDQPNKIRCGGKNLRQAPR